MCSPRAFGGRKQLTSAIAVALVLAGCSSPEAGTSSSGGPTTAPGETPSAPPTRSAAPTTGPAPTPTVDSVETTEDGKVVTVDEDGVTHVVDAGPMPESLAREQWLAGHWRFDDPPPPLPPVIRTTTMEESNQVWGACMNDSGFPVALDAAGGMSWSAATEAQQRDYETAMYLCVAQYPWDPKAYQPWNDAQLRALHAHWHPYDGIPYTDIATYRRAEDLCPIVTPEIYDLATPPQE